MHICTPDILGWPIYIYVYVCMCACVCVYIYIYISTTVSARHMVDQIRSDQSLSRVQLFATP